VQPEYVNKLLKRYFPTIAAVVVILLLFILPAKSQGFLKTDGGRIVNARGQEVILRGMGLGGWMLQEPYMLQLAGIASAQHDIKRKITDVIGKERTETFYNAWLANHCTKADIDSLASWGFNSVRLPMHYNLYTLPVEEEPIAGQQTWLSKGFALTDSLLNWCKANKLYLILDLHAAPGAQGNDLPIADKDTTKPSLWQSAANQEKTIALWKKLAERYANEEWIGGYDLLNETNYGFLNPADKNGCGDTLNAPLKKLLHDLTVAIRQVDQRHIIFVEGNCWANNYKGLLPFADPNTVISFHKYWNYNDPASLQGFLKIREQYNAPLWMGEAGENSNVWFTEAIQLLESNGIGWAWWPMKKLGGNNPVQVKSNTGYQQLINYWKGSGERPAPEVAYQGLMQLADDIKIENTAYHKDVVDAMFRQVHSITTLPYGKHVIGNNSIIYATDYDLGRSGYAYHDKDSANYRVSTGTNEVWNKGRAYRNDGVDISICSDSLSNGFYVSHIEEGEWMQYTIQVKKAGVYNIGIRTAAKDSVGQLQLSVSDKAQYPVLLPATGGEQKWVTTLVKNVPLSKGSNTLRVQALKGGFGFNYIQLQSAPKNNR
jgi:hypothetical protein